MTLRKVVVLLGVLNMLVLLAHATLSYVEAPAAHYSQRDRWEIAFHDRVGARIASVIAPVAVLGEIGKESEAERVRDLTVDLSGGGWMTNPWHFVLLYTTPLVLSTIITLALLAVMARRSGAIDTSIPASLLRWSYLYAVVMAFAMPTLVEDFWLSVGWGRMFWMGDNPYYHLSVQALAQLPLESPGPYMPFGPLWALVTWGVEAMTQGSPFWSGAVFKLLLLGAWLLALRLLHGLLRERSVRDQCMGLAMVGWLPLGVVQTVGEGHNDIFMIVLVLLWLRLLEQRQPVRASVSLALSVTMKYATAPLFLLDLLHRRDRNEPVSFVRQIREYVPRGLIALAVIMLAFLPVFRGRGFFAGMAGGNSARFYLPSDAVRAVAALTNLPIWRFANLVQLIFPVVALVTIWKYVREPSRDSFRIAVAGIMLLVVFNAARHIWPWYVIWLLLTAATVPRTLIARWAMGVALTAPFPLVVWVAFPDSSGLAKFLIPSLCAYAGALLWVTWLWRYFVPSDPVAGHMTRSDSGTLVPEATV